MISTKGFWASAAIAVLLVPASSFAVSFDCTKAQSFREKSVCSNTELGKLDDELSSAYQTAKGTWGDQQSLKDSQRNWVSETNRCADEGCIDKAYRDRIAELAGSDAEEGDTDNVEEGDTGNVGGGNNAEAEGAPTQAEPSEKSSNPLEGVIQQELEKVERQNRAAAEAVGDYSLSGAKPTAPPPLDPNADGKVAVQGDIKGIRIGMAPPEVWKLVNDSLARGKQCEQGAVQANDSGYLIGDYVIVCREAFVYFGEVVDTAQFFFLDNKLKMASLFYFFSRNENFDPLPEIVRALADSKFRAEPKIGRAPNLRDSDSGEMTAEWTDAAGDTIIYGTNYWKHLSGCEYKNGALQMRSGDYEQYTAARKAALINRAEEQQRAVEQQRKNDL